MKTIAYSAPGKVIISGEHAVVYGKPAFVTAINLRLIVEVASSTVESGGKLGEIIKKVREYIRKNELPFADNKCSLTVRSSIPVGRGLGSSAALSVAGSAALLEFFTGREQGQETINNCAYAVEKLFHTNPSGVDTTASCFGGLIFFRKEFEFLKTISRLHMNIPKSIASSLFLVDSGAPTESTAQMVESVGKRYNKYTAETDASLSAIEKCTKRLVAACMLKDYKLFSMTIRLNQDELKRLGVVSRKADNLLRSLNCFGSGKITGAGGKKEGSGFLLFFAEDPKTAIEFLKKKSISYLPFIPSPHGVQKER